MEERMSFRYVLYWKNIFLFVVAAGSHLLCDNDMSVACRICFIDDQNGFSARNRNIIISTLNKYIASHPYTPNPAQLSDQTSTSLYNKCQRKFTDIKKNVLRG